MEVIVSCICSVTISFIVSFMMSNLIGMHYMESLTNHQEELTNEMIKSYMDYCEKVFVKKNDER